MSPVFDCRDESQLLPGMRAARRAIGSGELVVMPTDTVYGIAADAFSPAAVQRLLDAKGRGRQSPPPVLVAGITTLKALVAEVPPEVEQLVGAFWPGGLTIVLPAQPSLTWDLGDTGGTVAVRMPAHPLALELLEDTGPLAVSSANLTGKAAAIMAHDALSMLGDSVSVYLDAGPSKTGIASTIIDATSLVGPGERVIRVLREGAVSREELRDLVGDLLEPIDPDDSDAGEEAAAHDAEPQDAESADAASPEPEPASAPQSESESDDAGGNA